MTVKALVSTVSLGLMLAGLAGAAQAADITGVWRTPEGDGIEVFKCGQALCGKAIGDRAPKPGAATTDVKNKDAALRGRPLKGLVFMTGFTGGPSNYSGGRLYNPNDGNTYSGTVTLTPDDTIKLKGCALSVLCRTEVWTRAK